jgi:hypothetical protein
MSDDTSQNTAAVKMVYPIRMLTNGWMRSTELMYYQYVWHTETPIDGDRTSMASFVLRSTFKETTHPVLSAKLLNQVQSVLSNNSRIISDMFDSHSRYDENMAYMGRNHLNDFITVIANHDKTFKSWKDFANADSKEIDEDRISRLDNVPLSDFAPNVKGCEIDVSSNHSSGNKIFLPVNATKLFNAMVLAENTGAALYLSIDHSDLSKQGRLGLKAISNATTKRLKIGGR